MKNINWQADLDQMAEELPLLHKNLFYKQSRDEFIAGIDRLKKRIDNLDTLPAVMEISRIVASLGDAHTTVALPQFNRLPFACYWFKEGIFITAALDKYPELIFHRLVAIAGMSIDNVVSRLSGIISHENKHFLMAQLPEYLICVEILLGLAIISEVDQITITVEDQLHETRELTMATIKMDDWPPAAGENGSAPTAKLPLYRKNRDQHFWREFDPPNNLLYLNYNSCKDMPNHPVDQFARETIREIESNGEITRLVIDLRNNGGGNSELFKKFLQWLSKYPRLNQPGRLFVVVGRDTFSSALLNAYFLKFNTQAVFVGDATGGKPNCYGEVKYLTLNSSGLYIRYSTKYYHLVDDDALPSFMPDMTFEVTFDDYQRNIDPCMDWITGAQNLGFVRSGRESLFTAERK